MCKNGKIFKTGSDSEGAEDPVVGNVNKFAVVPPGYSGRPKKGHIIFDACFESGKLFILVRPIKGP